MANLLLTEACVRSCPYCFAKQYMDDVKDQTAISKENLIYVADFLEKSGVSHISLLGGEPLIHPDAAGIIKYLAVERHFNVNVFTSGIIPNSKRDTFISTIKSFADDENVKLGFVVNVNEPRFSSKKELELVDIFLSSLGKLCALSFNIYRKDCNMDFLSEYILKYGLRRHVRFGLANPIPGSGNSYLKPEDFVSAKNIFMNALQKMYELEIYPGLDCGFPMCMFTDEELGRLYKYTRDGLMFECGPTIDIGPDLSCWCCFPLSNVSKRSLKDFNDFNELDSFFNDIQKKYRVEVTGIFKECDTCRNYRDGICAGGCLAHVLNNYYEEGDIRM